MRRDRRRRAAMTVIAVVLAALLVLPFLGPALGASATERPAGGDVAAAAPAPTAALPVAAGPVVLVGFTGVRWEDVSALRTPTLWKIAGSGAVANLVVRSVRSWTCPADGWLAISAGRRAADVPAPAYGHCRALREPAGGVVPAWEHYLSAAADASYDAEPGLLGDLLADEGLSTAALGPGAAIALAGRDGTVGTADAGYARRSPDPALIGAQLAPLLDRDLVVADLGSVRDRNRPLVPFPDDEATTEPEPTPPDSTPPPAAWTLPEPDRADLVAAVDARLGAVLETVRAEAPEATVVVASLGDSGTTSSLQVAGVLTAADLADLGSTDADGGLLATRSTRQDGIVQSTDLTPTLLHLLGVDAPAGLPGAPTSVVEDGRSGQARVAALQDVARHADEIGPLVPPFTTILIAINLLLYAAVTVGLNRRVVDRMSASVERLRGSRWRAVARGLRSGSPVLALRALRAVAVFVAAVPIASVLANLVPWWRTDSTALALYGSTAIIAALIALVALRGPWRDDLLAPMAVVAGVTAGVLAVDVLTGATLQLSSLLGIRIQVGGRFYGFNNSSFSLFAAATILLATCVAEPLVRRGRRRLAGVVVAVIGLVVVVLDGAPTIGADFGGPPALIPAFAVLALLAAGVRLTWRRVALVLGGAAFLAVSFSVVDWLRPPAERSHLGRFVETVLDGGLWDVVVRKLSQNLANFFGSSLTFLAIGGTVLVVVVLSRPLRQAARTGGQAYGWLAGGTLPRLDRDALMLTPGLVALAVALGIGFLVNDSGIVIPAMGITLAVPLLIAVVTGWLLRMQHRRDAAAPQAEPV